MTTDALLIAETKEVLEQELPQLALKALERLAAKTENPIDNMIVKIAHGFIADPKTKNSDAGLVLRKIEGLLEPSAAPAAIVADLQKCGLSAETLTNLVDLRQSAEAEALRKNKAFCAALGKSLRTYGPIVGRSIGLIARAGLLGL